MSGAFYLKIVHKSICICHCFIKKQHRTWQDSNVFTSYVTHKRQDVRDTSPKFLVHTNQHLRVASLLKDQFSLHSVLYAFYCVLLLYTPIACIFNPLMGTLKPQSIPLYSSTLIGSLVADGWAVIKCNSPPSVPSSYQSIQHYTYLCTLKGKLVLSIAGKVSFLVEIVSLIMYQ